MTLNSKTQASPSKKKQVLIGKRGVNTTLDPEIPRPEDFKSGDYLDSLLSKGVRYRRQLYLMLMLITRTVETGGVTILRNDIVKQGFKNLYGIEVSDKQIFNLLKKLEKDKQIYIKVQAIRSFSKEGIPVFKKKRIIYVWASYYLNNCKIESKLSRYGNISTLPEKTSKIPLKYKIKKPTEIFIAKTQKTTTIIPFIETTADAYNKKLLPKWFKHGVDSGLNPNAKKTIVWGFEDIKAFRDQNIIEFLSYMGYSPVSRMKYRKKDLAKTLKLLGKEK